MLIAPAIRCDAFAPRGPYHHTLDCVDRVSLIINPRDIPAVIKELKQHRFHLFPAVNTLFGAIARHPDARRGQHEVRRRP